MITAAAGTMALTSLRSLYDIAKDIRNSDDPEKLRVAAGQMFDLALAAREQVAALQDERNAALVETEKVKGDMAKLEAWAKEKGRYELKAIAPGMFAQMLRKEERGNDPPHWLCPNCFEDGKKSLFQKPRDMYINCECARCEAAIAPRNEPAWID